MDITAQVLAAMNFTAIQGVVVAAGLALVGISFVSFVLRQAIDAASGKIGGSDPDDDERDN